MDLIIEIYYQNSADGPPSTSDLVNALNLKRWIIYSRIRALYPEYIQKNRGSSHFYLRVESNFYYTGDEIGENFNDVIGILSDYVREVFPYILNHRCIRAVNILYPKIIQENLSTAVKKYRELILIFNEERIDHGLPDMDTGNTANRYILTENGEEIFFAWQRGEFSN